MPERIQLKRSKGWRKPEGAVVVSRPSRWGNPFGIHRCNVPDGPWWRVSWPDEADVDWFRTPEEARRLAVEMFKGYVLGEFEDVMDFDQADRVHLRSELRGRDLACWCPLDQPCHADVLLELANGDPS